jgi:AraC family transcriptional regulator
MQPLRQAFEAYGFEVMDDGQSKLVKEVKTIVEEMFTGDFDLTEIKFSKYISSKLYKDYDIISSSFSSCQGITLEKYILNRTNPSATSPLTSAIAALHISRNNSRQ